MKRIAQGKGRIFQGMVIDHFMVMRGHKSIAYQVYKEIKEFEQFDDNGFSIHPFEDIAKIIEKYGGSYETCSCGSQYCDICNGSVDPSIKVVFPDNSKLYIGDPYEVVYPRFYVVDKEVE